jgi:hypothetical protein
MTRDQRLFEAVWNQRLFEAVWKEIAAQVEDRRFIINPDRVASIPIEAQTIYWLWYFQAEAAANGLEVFLLQSLGIYSPQIHAALQAVGSKELVRRLESAIPLARECSCAEFGRLPDQSWFERFHRASEYPTLQSVDWGIYPIFDTLTSEVVAFIMANASVLFEPEAGGGNGAEQSCLP